METINVLVWPSTCEAGREVVRSLKGQRNIEIFEASSDEGKHHHLYDIRDENWKGALKTLVNREKVDYVYPTHDEVIKAYCDDPPNLPVVWITHSRSTLKTCLSKRATYNLLKDVVEVPVVYSIPDVVQASDPGYPFWIKPDFGYGGRRATKVENRQQLYSAIETSYARVFDDALITEYLPGLEITVDCYSYGGELLWCVARTREQIKSGMSTKTTRLKPNGDTLDWWDRWADEINDKIHFNGAWYFQVKERADGSPVLLEVAPRIAGGCALARVNGVNLPLLSLYAAQGIKPRILDIDKFGVLHKPLCTEFKRPEFNTLWIDVDDTLLLKDGTLDPGIISIIVARKNLNLPTMLITRDGSRLDRDANGWKMGVLCSMLQKLVRVKKEESKADYIKPDDCLIDDSFSERSEVFDKTGALVLDPQIAKEVLL